MDATNLIGGCLTKLLRACGAGGDGSTVDIQFLNSVMAELLNVTCKSCQIPANFDASDPASYNQIWQAITRFGGTDGIGAWSNGSTSLLVTDGDCAGGCNLYVAIPTASPSTNQPSTTTGHWLGPYCSVGFAVSAIYNLLISNMSSIKITTLDCVNNQITVTDGTSSCTIGGSGCCCPFTMQSFTPPAGGYAVPAGQTVTGSVDSFGGGESCNTPFTFTAPCPGGCSATGQPVTASDTFTITPSMFSGGCGNGASWGTGFMRSVCT